MNKFISFLLETTRYAHFTFDISYFCVSVFFFSIVMLVLLLKLVVCVSVFFFYIVIF